MHDGARLIGAVRSAAALAVGDMVLTPLGRHALVRGHWSNWVLLNYCDSDGGQIAGDEVYLQPTLLRFVRAAPPAVLSRGFFTGERAPRDKPQRAVVRAPVDDYSGCE